MQMSLFLEYGFLGQDLLYFSWKPLKISLVATFFVGWERELLCPKPPRIANIVWKGGFRGLVRCDILWKNLACGHYHTPCQTFQLEHRKSKYKSDEKTWKVGTYKRASTFNLSNKKNSESLGLEIFGYYRTKCLDWKERIYGLKINFFRWFQIKDQHFTETIFILSWFYKFIDDYFFESLIRSVNWRKIHSKVGSKINMNIILFLSSKIEILHFMWYPQIFYLLGKSVDVIISY